jgi:class 3 adenylate cyclase/predicted ATPase
MPERATKAKATCANCGAAIRAKDRFCAGCGAPIAAAQAARSSAASASLQVVAETADALLEQRKVVTIVFADLSGSTPLAEKLDPEELRGILGSYFGALARQIQRYEGTIDKYIGDAVMAVFGAPISHEDDAERAVHAALAMQASIVRLNDDLDRKYRVRLSLRIGVNTGEVVAGFLAGDVQRAYTVVGDAVNTAQRLESAAPLGQVLVSETTRRLAMHRFEFERRDPIVLKGKSEPVVTYRVVRELDTTIEPDATRFVGRGEELAVLTDALEQARAGRGSVIAIVGEPGVGKSRLVAEFRNALPPHVDRMTARCASYEQSTPYALIADFIRGAFGIHAADDEAAATAALQEGLTRYAAEVDPTIGAVVLEIIGYPERSALDPERKRALLVGFLRSVLARAAARAPFLLAAEDLHWGDDASLRVLGELVADTSTLPCLFLTTSRTGWIPPWPAQRIELTPFDDAGGRELIEAVLQLPVEPALADSVLARTGGNPFFIEEVVRELQSAGSLIERDGRIGADARAAERLPATITEVLEARLDRLPEAATRVVRPAAVIGRTFWYRVLAHLLPEGSVGDGLGVLEAEQFVVTRATTPELTYAFRQALVRDVAYQVQLQSVRRKTHTAVGWAIESLFAERLDEFIDLLAFHYERGDDPKRALEWVMRAGDRAKGLFANTEALAMYGSALALAADGSGPRDAGVIHERIGDVQLLMGRYDDAIASYTQGAAHGGEATGARRAVLARKSGNAIAMKGDYAGAHAIYEQALELARDDGAERARIQVQLGQLQWRQGEHAAARATLKAAVSEGEKAGADDAVAEGLKQLGNVTILSGARDEATTYYRLSLAIYERLGDTAGLANVQNNLAVTHRRMGQWLEALAVLEQTLALRELMGDPWGIGAVHNNIGEVHRTLGEPKNAIAPYERALAVWSRIGYASGVALALTGLGAAIAEAGDPDRGIAVLRDAEAKWAAVGSTPYLADLYQFLGAAELARGDLDAAQSAAERSRALAQSGGSAQLVAVADRLLGEILVARGERTRGLIMVRLSRDALAELDEVPERIRADAVLARLGA